MSVVKERIKFNGLDLNIKFGIKGNEDVIGIQQEIDELTNETKTDLINPIVDGEVRRFKYDPSINGAELKFFFSNDLSQYSNTFQYAGFSTSEILNLNTKLLNSFYIIEIYDTYDPFTQTKILTNYMTKISDGENNGSFQIPYYKISVNNKNQLYYLHVPKSSIDSMYGATKYLYMKLTFFNAIDGSVSLFYNKENELLSTAEKMYFKIRINKNTLTWRFINKYYPNISAFELSPNSAYVNRVKNTVNAQDVKKQNYPAGVVFDHTTGTYSTE